MKTNKGNMDYTHMDYTQLKELEQDRSNWYQWIITSAHSWRL